MLGEEITQASKSEHRSKLYSFLPRTVYIRGGIYRGPSLLTLHKMTILPPNLNNYNPFQLQRRSGPFLFLSLHFSTLGHQSP
jgi:hypothetical protein